MGRGTQGTSAGGLGVGLLFSRKSRARAARRRSGRAGASETSDSVFFSVGGAGRQGGSRVQAELGDDERLWLFELDKDGEVKRWYAFADANEIGSATSALGDLKESHTDDRLRLKNMSLDVFCEEGRLTSGRRWCIRISDDEDNRTILHLSPREMDSLVACLYRAAGALESDPDAPAP